MFKHTMYTKLAYWIMALNTLVGLTALLGLFTTTEMTEISGFFLLIFVVFVNALICIGVYKKNLAMLRFANWFYPFQAIGLEAENFTFQLYTGLQLTVSMPIANSVVSINFAIVGICILLYAALGSANERRY